MIVNIEAWLNKNKVAYTANRNKKNGNQIDLNCTFSNWDDLSEKYHKIKETDFSIKQRMLMSFIFCTLKPKLELTSELFLSNDHDRLPPEQKSALSLFIEDELEEEYEDDEDKDKNDVKNEDEDADEDTREMPNVDDMIEYIDDEIYNTEYQGAYYYLLKIVKHKIQELNKIPRNTHDNKEEDDNLSSASHSSQASTTPNSDVIVSPAPLEQINKKAIIATLPLVIDINKINIDDPDYGDFFGWTMLKNAANYVMDGFWSLFSWSNDFVIQHFFDKKVAVSNDNKQAVKNNFHAYKDKVDEFTTAISLYNNTNNDRPLKESSDNILAIHQQIDTKQKEIIAAIEKSKEGFYTQFFNENLIAFYADLSTQLLAHQNTIHAAKQSVEQETKRIFDHYQELIKLIETLNEQTLPRAVNFLMMLEDSELIYEDLAERINKSSDQIKFNFLEVVKKATERMVANQLTTNISSFAENESKLTRLITIADKINHIHKDTYVANIFRLRAPVIEKVEKVQIHLVEMTRLLDELNKGQSIDIVALAIHLLVTSKHAPSLDFPDYEILERLYDKNDWWPNFAAIYNVLNQLLGGKVEKIDINNVLNLLDLYSDKKDYLYHLENACEVLKHDYPKTALLFSDGLSTIIAQRGDAKKEGKFCSAGSWSAQPVASPSKITQNFTIKIPVTFQSLTY